MSNNSNNSSFCNCKFQDKKIWEITKDVTFLTWEWLQTCASNNCITCTTYDEADDFEAKKFKLIFEFMSFLRSLQRRKKNFKIGPKLRSQEKWIQIGIWNNNQLVARSMNLWNSIERFDIKTQSGQNYRNWVNRFSSVWHIFLFCFKESFFVGKKKLYPQRKYKK